MFSFIKKYRDRRLKEKITLSYLSNPITSDDRDYIKDIEHINYLFLHITDANKLKKIFNKKRNN